VEIPEGSIVMTSATRNDRRKAWTSVGFLHKSTTLGARYCVPTEVFFFSTHDERGKLDRAALRGWAFSTFVGGDYYLFAMLLTIFSRTVLRNNCSLRSASSSIFTWLSTNDLDQPAAATFYRIARSRDDIPWRTTLSCDVRNVEVNPTRLGLCDGCVRVRV